MELPEPGQAQSSVSSAPGADPIGLPMGFTPQRPSRVQGATSGLGLSMRGGRVGRHTGWTGWNRWVHCRATGPRRCRGSGWGSTEYECLTLKRQGPKIAIAV